MKNISKKKLILLIASAAVILAAVVIVLVFFLGKDDTVEEPVEVVKELPIVDAPYIYRLGEDDSILALPVGASVIVREEVPEEEEDAEEAEDVETGEDAQTGAEDAAEPVSVTVTYHYEGIADPLSRIAMYCELLLNEEFGFTPVDESIMETEPPVIEGSAGGVHLVRPVLPAEGETEVETGIEAEEFMLSLQIRWESETCSVTVGRIEGGIVLPPVEPPVYRPPLTLSSAVDYLYSCHPSELGLPGESMVDYQILPLDGAVLVGTTPCLRINIYSIDQHTGTNEIAGQYLLADNGQTLFYVDETGEIRELWS